MTYLESGPEVGKNHLGVMRGAKVREQVSG